EYEKAVSLDSKFDLAQESLDDVEIAQSAATEPKVEPANLESEFETTSDGMENLTKSSRLLNTSIAALTGQTPQGDNDTRKPVQEGTGNDNATPTTAIIPIRIPLPPGGN
ncbi:MAG: hypothetical protein ACE5HX_06270, partial [bacterium]